MDKVYIFGSIFFKLELSAEELKKFLTRQAFFLILFAPLPLFFELVGNFETLPIDWIKCIEQ